LSGGVVIDLIPDQTEHYFRYFQGDHPNPSGRNVAATQELISFLKASRSDDLVIFLISGGGSTLLAQPRDFEVTLEQKIFQVLTSQGATIQELNTVRKHLSLARGGFLADYAYPATIVSLIFSDVPGNDLSFIASGPTVLDQTTVFEADHLIDKYHVRSQLDLPFDYFVETPKDPTRFARVKNILLLSNQVALEAAQQQSLEMGYQAIICDLKLSGEARQVGPTIAKVLHQSPAGTVLLYGGETTVTIKGQGSGGRNQELVLATLSELREDEVILSLASDGHDNGPAAGAIGDIKTVAQAQVLGLSIEKDLIDNNSEHFFAQVGDALTLTTPGANVSDLILAVKIKQ
jgi:glycerate-2-kinase